VAFVAELEPGESVLLQESYQPSQKSEPFAITISDRALFLPSKRAFAVSDPYYYKRVPHGSVLSVSVRKLNPIGLWCLAAVLVVTGALTMVWMMAPVVSGEGGKIYGVPLGLLVAGLVLPFAARGRRGLVIRHTDGTFRWKPVVVVDAASKGRAEAILVSVQEACRRTGLRVIEEAA
jgi:hypothetical protein